MQKRGRSESGNVGLNDKNSGFFYSLYNWIGDAIDINSNEANLNENLLSPSI